MSYPNKTDILQGLDPPKIELAILADWKDLYYKGWSNKLLKDKQKQIKILLLTINKIKKGNKLKIRFDKRIGSCYSKGLIILNDTSIITALHELAHHFFGESELIACQYSIGLFKETFPKSFEKLTFEGHKLIKK